QPIENGVVNLQVTPYFTANLMSLSQPAQRDYAPLDSFVAFMCVAGEGTIQALDCESPDNIVTIRTGEAVLIPASLNDIVLTPSPEMQLIEVYVEDK
ncbi:MAG: mannose-6-phosphate isomerase, partial [Firmicutes bacterium]|nr:mannose-6-phosphate isomerase [Bacillota bacterium]